MRYKSPNQGGLINSGVNT